MSRKRIALWSVFCAVAFVVAELVARYGLGLGDPPISIPDPEIDYLFAPDQDCHRFGNRIVYNNCSMRCDFDVHCGFEGRRVFVVGDSVVNGGTLIAHEKIATTLLQERVDTIIRAVGEVAARSTCSARINIALDIYGAGTEEMRLKKMAAKYGDAIKFYPPVPIDQVRKLMREHDVYVLASNAYEGWGAVVSEALEEGMKVIGTYEAGSSATILPEECLFLAGDWRRPMRILLDNHIPKIGIESWSATNAAFALINVSMC